MTQQETQLDITNARDPPPEQAAFFYPAVETGGGERSFLSSFANVAAFTGRRACCLWIRRRTV